MRKRLAAGLAVIATTLVAATGAASGVKTAKPPYLVPTAPGVAVDPILSTGDIVGDYQMSGIPDGLGAYDERLFFGPVRGGPPSPFPGERRARGSFTVVMNHELGRSFPLPPAGPPGVDSRISKLEIDGRDRSVVAGEYLFKGTEGFERFCSATLMLISGRPLYFTGEEAVPMAGQPPGPAHDGSSIVLDPETGAWTETPHFGHFQHENVVPLQLSKWVFLSSEDDFRPGPSFLYAYIADTFSGAVSGQSGSLYVWRANDLAKNSNAAVAKGESIPGHFVPLTQVENANSTALKAAATAKKGFVFDRLEDIAVRPDIAGRTYIADTGKPPTTSRGRVYQFDISPLDPTQASLKMILNGDAPDGDDIFNPDNMDASEKVLMIQEDRESAFRGCPCPPNPPAPDAGFGRVLAYDFSKSTLTAVARVNTPANLRPGTWESSGIIKAFDVIGPNWWLLDVQAHNTFAPQPGVSLVPNSSSGEDGQLLALFVPGSGGPQGPPGGR